MQMASAVVGYWHPQLQKEIKEDSLHWYLEDSWQVCGHTLQRALPKALKLPSKVRIVPSLPSELWYEIVSYLHERDLVSVSLVCDHFRILGHWFLIQRLYCGLTLRREIDNTHMISLFLFFRRWPTYQRYLYGLLSAT